jgi:Thiamine pyrophosphate enzyme, C-terminal TPP binding domain
MGFGLPSAVGAKVAAPNKTVINIDGDASFTMTSSELSTASHYNIGVKVLILNNDFQGMVRQWQGLYRSFFFFPVIHFNLTNGRPILWQSVLTRTDDEPRFRAARKSDGCTRHSSKQRFRATKEDERIPRVRREQTGVVGMCCRDRRTRVPDGVQFSSMNPLTLGVISNPFHRSLRVKRCMTRSCTLCSRTGSGTQTHNTASLIVHVKYLSHWQVAVSMPTEMQQLAQHPLRLRAQYCHHPVTSYIVVLCIIKFRR